MESIVVVGGRGHLGVRTVAALRRAGLGVAVAGRRGPVVVDSSRPETFVSLEPFGVVVDVTDTVTSRPDALVAWCLARGKTVLEATSDAPCVERLADAHRATSGRLVLGGGIFTGLSNLLARDVSEAVGGAQSIVVGISSSPFSGAGTGTVALMVDALNVPSVRYAGGRRTEVPGVTRGPVLDFAGRMRPTVRMSLAEPSMLHASTGAAAVDVYFAPRPALLVPAFAALPPSVVRAAWYRACLRGYFTLLRRALLRGKATTVTLVATAQRDGAAASRWLRAGDGMAAGGAALAAMVEATLAGPSWHGLRYVDDVCRLEAVLARANTLTARPLLTLGAPPGDDSGDAPRAAATS